jgi:hypothetical protein
MQMPNDDRQAQTMHNHNNHPNTTMPSYTTNGNQRIDVVWYGMVWHRVRLKGNSNGEALVASEVKEVNAMFTLVSKYAV